MITSGLGRGAWRGAPTASLLGLLVFGGCGPSSAPSLPFTPALGFPQPPTVTIAASDIAIHTLRCAITTQSVGGKSVTGPTYNGRILGPTFRMKPGATDFHVSVINDFPANPTGQRGGAFPHDPYTTNLHTHGLTVDPGGISDNVYRTMQPGTTNEVLVELVPDQPPGTFWYHPHKHGTVTYQMMGGMAGFLIIEGGPGSLDEVPEIAAARDLVMGFQTIRVDTQCSVPWVNTAATNFKQLWSTLGDGDGFMTTNGVVAPTLTMRPGEVVRCRMLNATLGETLALRIVSTDVQRLAGLPMYVIAHDGLTVPEMVTVPVFGEPFILGAGNRVDVLIKGLDEGNYELRTYNTNDEGGFGTPVVASISPQGIESAPREARVFPHPPNTPGWNWPITLVKIEVEGTPNDMPLPAGLLPLPPALDAAATNAIMTATPSKTRNVLFELCGPLPMMTGTDCSAFDALFGYDTAAYWGGTEFDNRLFVRDLDDPGPVFSKEALFKHGEPLFSDMYTGAIEEWTIHNTSNSDHPYHQHVNPFLLTHINGVPLPVPEWRDTVLVPAASTAQPTGTVTLRMRYHPDITGTFVAHCHILTHEDIGMMQELRIRHEPGTSR